MIVPLAAEVARLKGVPPDEARDVLRENAGRLFGHRE